MIRSLEQRKFVCLWLWEKVYLFPCSEYLTTLRSLRLFSLKNEEHFNRYESTETHIGDYNLTPLALLYHKKLELDDDYAANRTLETLSTVLF